MPTIDVILTWPKSLDFPIWRSFIGRNRHRFNKVLIYFADNSSPYDFRTFLRDKMADITWVEKGLHYSEDWRNNAVNNCLAQSNADWVWFTEPDFLIKDPESFFAGVERQMAISDVVYYLEGERKHPACMFVKREVINKTKRDFGVVAGVLDHFGAFTNQVDEAVKEGKGIALLPKTGTGLDFYHMNGLTQNYHLVAANQIDGIYQPGIFLMYNTYARMQQVPQHPDFIKLCFQADFLLMPLTKCFQGN